MILGVLRQPGANTIQVVDSIKELLPTFRSLTPSAVHIDVMYDQSQSIRDSVDDVQFTLLLTVCSGRARHLRVPRQSLGNTDPKLVTADFNHWYVCGDEAARLQL